MKVGIYFNPAQAEPQAAEQLAQTLVALGGEARILSAVSNMEDCDRVIVLGGDGTMLHAARTAAPLGVPIVGINYGTLGFLTEFDRGETENAARLALDASCPVIHRTMLEVDLNGEKTYCLNELSMLHAVAPDRTSKAVRISVIIEGSRAGDFHADGLIVCTPTGSTAYSLSAGGSIMTPDCKTFQLTPVCAFSLRSRPIAYPDDCALRFILPKDEKLVLYGDGIYLGEADETDHLTVKKAERTAVFLTRSKGEYFRRLTEKIN